MNRPEPWQTAEIPGPKKAFPITKPEIVVAMVKKARRPILIVGHKAVEIELEKKGFIDYLIRFAKASKIRTVATAHIGREFIERGFQPAASMPAMDIANRLGDPEWRGLDGKGQYDLALFVGLPYYMGWLMLSALKNFAPEVKTISLDRFYQPNASWSFPNVGLEEWKKSLDAIVNGLKG